MSEAVMSSTGSSVNKFLGRPVTQVFLSEHDNEHFPLFEIVEYHAHRMDFYEQFIRSVSKQLGAPSEVSRCSVAVGVDHAFVTVHLEGAFAFYWRFSTDALIYGISLSSCCLAGITSKGLCHDCGAAEALDPQMGSIYLGSVSEREHHRDSQIARLMVENNVNLLNAPPVAALMYASSILTPFETYYTSVLDEQGRKSLPG